MYLRFIFHRSASNVIRVLRLPTDVIYSDDEFDGSVLNSQTNSYQSTCTCSEGRTGKSMLREAIGTKLKGAEYLYVYMNFVLRSAECFFWNKP